VKSVLNLNEMIASLEKAIDINPLDFPINLLLRLEKAYRISKQQDKIALVKQKIIDKTPRDTDLQTIWLKLFSDKIDVNNSNSKKYDKEFLQKYFYCLSTIKTIAIQKDIDAQFPNLNSFSSLKFKRRNKERLNEVFLKHDKYIENGFVEINSPFDKCVLRSNESYYIHLPNSFIFYLFRGQNPFFLVFGDVWNEIIGYYFPVDEIYVPISKNGLNIENAICKLKASMISNIANYDKFIQTNKKKCIIVENNHFAHHIWNELSAIERIINKKLDNFIDTIFVLAQPLGGLKDIFKEISNKVKVIDKTNIDLFEEKLIKENYQTLPLGDAFISKSLINKIKICTKKSVSEKLKNEVNNFASETEFRLWISLRTGAKTWTDQIEGYAAIIENISQIHSKIGVIIDGYSMPFFTEGNRKIRSAIKKERKFVGKLIGYLELKKICFKVLIGGRIDEALYWGRIADYYIVHQGTIQHKIAWFYNCPGYIHTNIGNLERPYEERPGVWEKEGMIKPSFVKKSMVSDDNEITFLRGKWDKNGVAANYSIDLEKMQTEIITDLLKLKTKKMTNRNSQKWGKTKILGPDSFSNIQYTKVLEKVHLLYGKDYCYFEIGTNKGNSMRLSNGNAVGVDPNFIAKQNIINKKQSLSLYQTTSDSFFEKQASKVFQNTKINVAFIDGLHHGDQVFVDFVNTEKHSNENTIFFFHDILPRTYETALRNRETQMWTGDVWKAIWLLYRERKDLDFYFIDAPPSGLLMVKYNSNISLENQSNVEENKQKINTIEDKDLYDYLDNIKICSAIEFIAFLNNQKRIPLTTDLTHRKIGIVK